MGLLDFQGKRVAIAGCFSGMGEAAARKLVELGAEVHGFDIKESPVELASFTYLDLSKPEAIDTAIASFEGEIDCLFTCSGLPQTFPPLEVVKVNFAGHRQWVEGLLPRVRRGGSVTSISSAVAYNYQARIAVLEEFVSTQDFGSAMAWAEAHPEDVADGYALAKESLCVWFMQRSKRSIEEQGVRMNVTLPGLTQTPMMPAFEQFASAKVVDIFALPIARRSTPEEQALPLLFLGSDAASYINGHLLTVDGGFTAAFHTGQIDLQAEFVRATDGQSD